MSEEREPRPRPNNPHRRRPAHWRPAGQRQDRTEQSRNVSGSISVVIPLLNEEESLQELSRQLESVLDRISRGRYEVIFIDDGSTDGSYNVIKDINSRNRKFKAVRFRTNHGKSSAQSSHQIISGFLIGLLIAAMWFVSASLGYLEEDPNTLKEGYRDWETDRKSVV